MYRPCSILSCSTHTSIDLSTMQLLSVFLCSVGPTTPHPLGAPHLRQPLAVLSTNIGHDPCRVPCGSYADGDENLPPHVESLPELVCQCWSVRPILLVLVSNSESLNVTFLCQCQAIILCMLECQCLPDVDSQMWYRSCM